MKTIQWDQIFSFLFVLHVDAHIHDPYRIFCEPFLSLQYGRVYNSWDKSLNFISVWKRVVTVLF
jgi:hypothetical protein